MGCGSSKQVEVVPTTKPSDKPSLSDTTHATADVKRSSSPEVDVRSVGEPVSPCINQENGESLTTSECGSSPSQADGVPAQNDTDERTIERNQTNDANNSLVPASGERIISSDGGKSFSDNHPTTINDQINYGTLFQILKNAVYSSDIQQISSLRNDIEELKDQIQEAAYRKDGDLPPIPEDESNIENPRRIRPPRDYHRERSALVALEVATAFRILKCGGSYAKDISEIETLKSQRQGLEDYMKSINA